MKHLRWPLAAMAACAALAATAVPAFAASYGETGDAGQTRATAQPAVANPLTAITGNVAAQTADMYRVCSSGGSWSASTSTSSDPMLWLFDANGNTVAFNDDWFGLQSFISGNVGAGTYYLAIARYPYGYGDHHSDEWPQSGDPNGSGFGYTIHLQGFTSGSNCAGPVQDADGDGVNDDADNCPEDANPGQQNNDGDADGDVCDADDDNDSVEDADDNCALIANEDQANNDGDEHGDVCDSDDDNDSVEDADDNCALTANEDQANNDGDAEGDVCDADDDNDSVNDDAPDNCQFVANSDQKDVDGDGVGTACDSVEMPKTQDECKNDDWREFHDGASRFKNQGDCVSWVATEGRNEPAAS